MTTSNELVKDNQWWYSTSPLGVLVKNSKFIELAINGRRCILERSAIGSDGRETKSFKFTRDDDRVYWKSLRGTEACLELLDKDATNLEIEDDQEDDYQRIDAPQEEPASRAARVEENSSMDQIVHSKTHPLLFDAYIFVDWSANNRPNTGMDSIWIAEGYWENKQLVYGPADATCFNPRTRKSATQHLRNRLLEYSAKQKRVLVCCDFPYAYPICKESSLLGSTFREVWSTLQVRIRDDNQNRSNRFQVANDLNQLINGGAITGPFWGRPVSIPANELPFLAATKPRDIPRDSLREFRVVEERLRNCGKRPFSAWQLFGNGSVGSQALLGMPQLHTLRYDQELCHHSIVWPFETEHWKIPLELRPLIVHAEFWPTAILINKAFHPVKDAAQVMSFVAWAAKGDSDGSLMSYFNPLAPEDPDRELARKEGWILGFRGCP